MKQKPLASMPDQQTTPSPDNHPTYIDTLQALLDSVPNGMFTLDRHYRYLAFNRAHARQMLSTHNANIELGQNHLEYIASDRERENAYANLGKALGGEAFVKRDFVFSRANNTETFDIYYNPVKGQTAEVIAIQIIFESVSQRSQAETELQNTRQRFLTLFEQSNDAVFILSLEGKHLDFNHRATELLGYSRDELLALSLRDTSTELDQSLALMERLLSGESIMPYERLMRKKNGEVIPVELNVELIRDRQGQPLLIQSIVRDITERKLAEQKLRENEERYHSIVSQAVEAITLTDEDGIIIEWNQSAEKVTGVPASEALGQYTWDIQMRMLPPALQTPLNREVARQRIEHVLKTGNGPLIGSFESEIKHSETEHVFLRQLVFAVKTGRGYRIGTITHNITAAKIAERDLRESEQRYRLLFENMIDGFSLQEIITDENGRAIDFRILSANAAYQQHTGLDPEIVVGKTIREVIPEADPHQIESYGQVALTGEPLVYEYYSKTFNRYLRVHAFSPKHRQFATIFEDVTLARQAQADLKTAHDELEQRVRERTAEIQIANRELEKALRAKNEFMSAMSHELRTPLTGILGLAQVLQIPAYGVLSEKQLRAVENIDKSGQRLLELVNNVLDFSMLQSGSVATDLTFCSLDQVWMNIQQSIVLLTTHKQQRVRFSMLPERIHMQIDEQRLRQILTNLLNNASKFTPIGGELGLDVLGDPETRQVYLTVWDKGIGIAEPDLERIFHPFVQLDTGLSRRYEGTGLGLALVKNLCELLGGSIHVESTLGKGSRFTVTMPWKE